MDISSLIQEAVWLVWRRKSFWFLGALLGVGDLLSVLGRVLLQPRSANLLRNIESLPMRVAAGEFDSYFVGYLPGVEIVGGTLALALFFLLVWLAAAWADASLITAVSHPKPLSQSMRTGLRLLGRFIAVDALVFLPWFVLALLIMLLFSAAVIGSGLLAVQGRGETAVSLITIGLICVVPLSCLLIPVSSLSIIYRLSAFRDAALLNNGARHAVRHTWVVLRQHIGDVLLLVIFVSGGTAILNFVLNWTTIPLAGLMAVPQRSGMLSFAGVGAVLVLVVGLLLVLLLKAILHALASAVWTLAYQRMLEEEK